MESIPFFSSGICAILAQANPWCNLSAAGGILLGGKAGFYRSSEKTDFYPQGARLSFLRKRESKIQSKDFSWISACAGRRKTDQPMVIPIHPRVRGMLEALPRGLHTDRVFLLEGVSFEEFRRSFKTACKKAGITDFVFHDLRHCALNNLRLAGNDYFKIMTLSGHRTLSCFKRYNLVTEEELGKIRWSSTGVNPGTMDTYMDTKQKGAAAESVQPLDNLGRR